MKRQVLITVLVVISCAGLGFTDGVLGQNIWYVDDDGVGDLGPGDSFVGDPLEDGSLAYSFNTFQEGIDAAVGGDTVMVLDGTYSGVGNRDIDFLGKAITVRSMNGPGNCIIDCQGEGRGFYFHSNETVTSLVQGFTIRNGYAKGTGLESNGGGILFNQSQPTIDRCRIIDCVASGYGGGIFSSDGDTTITNSVITNNQAYEGGGIYVWDSHLTVKNCLIYNNIAEYDGGGIYFGKGQFDMVNCTITGNTADYGGGVSVYRCYAYFSNSVIRENTAFGAGNEIRLFTIISPNRMYISNSNVNQDPGDVSLRGDCIVYWQSGNIDAEPLYVDSLRGNYRLHPDSPCIDAGTNTPSGGLPVTDIEGNPRVIDGDNIGTARVDMGAYEFQNSGQYIEPSSYYPTFLALLGGTYPEDQTLTIRDWHGGVLNWNISYNSDWLEVSPTSGVSTGTASEVVLSVNMGELGIGFYECDLVITDPAAENSPLKVTVILHISIADEVHVPDEYGTIQSGIDAAKEGDTIIVEPGEYFENIYIEGKNITLRSSEPTNPEVVAATIIDGGRDVMKRFHSVVTFAGSETADCVLSGFTLTHGGHDAVFGGGINGNGTAATIQYNVIQGNFVEASFMPSLAYGGGLCDCDGVIQYNNISGNAVYGDDDPYYGGGLYGCDGIIRNNIISFNAAYGWAGPGGVLYSCNGLISNNVIFGNECTNGGLHSCSGTITNNIVWGNVGDEIVSSTEPIYCCIEGWVELSIENGNINTDPCFVDAWNGDFHLQSQAGRWDADSESWVVDGEGEHSGCIDAGDPVSDWTGELWPHGERINMGVYGGTAEASMSLNPVGNVCDFNGDGVVDMLDWGMLGEKWLVEQVLLKVDEDRDGVVDARDLCIFVGEWLWGK